jgi:prevent-host-death family protein
MHDVWQLQEAKNRFSEVVERALQQGPQLITRHGEKTAVVLSYAEYAKMRKSQKKLSQFFRTSPLAGVDLKRDKSLPRDEGEV